MVTLDAPSRYHGGTSYRLFYWLSFINCIQIWTLPKLALVFSTDGLSTLLNVLADSHDPAAPSLSQDTPRKPQDLDVEQLLLAPIGETSPQPHLCVRFLL